MKIHGLQKMTLLDFPGKVACTVFFGGCDMRCPFCHNAELLDGSAPPVMDEDESERVFYLYEAAFDDYEFGQAK